MFYERRFRQFQKIVSQFFTEILVMHSAPGDHILKLICYSYDENSLSAEPCIVYQLMENGSVSDHLRHRNPPLTWLQRLEIATGVAKGLAHLHGRKIVHGDIKSGNVLLDTNYKPFIGDFGLARKAPADPESHYTVTTIMGTEWYLPNDYMRSRHLTTSVDTFCFGILLLEMLTGKSPSFRDQKRKMIQRDIFLYNQEHISIDKDLDQNNPLRFILLELGKDCIVQDWNTRPPMDKILLALEIILKKISKGFPQSVILQTYHDGHTDPSTAQNGPKLVQNEPKLAQDPDTVSHNICVDDGIPRLDILDNQQIPSVVLDSQDLSYSETFDSD